MIGADLAESVFQVHGVDAEGTVVVRRQLRWRQVLPFLERALWSTLTSRGLPTFSLAAIFRAFYRIS
jgi:hypothetical protein